MRYLDYLTHPYRLLGNCGLIGALSLWVVFAAVAQNPTEKEEMHRFMVFFTDKQATPYSVSEPLAFLSQRALDRRKRHHISVSEEDLPVNPAYVRAVAALAPTQTAPSGVQVYFRTRWLNGLLVQCDSVYVPQMKALAFVRDVWLVAQGTRLTAMRNGTPLTKRRLTGNASLSTHNLTYHAQHNMLGVPDMYADGYIGEDVWVGVLDAGFHGLKDNRYFDHLFKGNGRVIDAYNYVLNDWDIEQGGFFNNHGRLVLSCMGSYSPDNDVPGTAIGAHYAFFVTEDIESENRIEEYNWLFAAERADSLGIDVINSSLGYYLFDIDSMSYSVSDMDGRTTVVSRAARLAYERGIAVVTSAGNEGSSHWGRIIAPTDAPEVLSVGGVDANQKIASFSSRGPSADGRIKPDVVAQGKDVVWNYQYADDEPVSGNIKGTSFSSPLMAGFLTSLKGRYLHDSPAQLYDRLRCAGTQADDPDNTYGYGIPNYKKVIEAPQLSCIMLTPTPPRVVDRAPENTQVAQLRAVYSGLGNNPMISYAIKDFNAKTAIFKVEGNQLKTNKRIDKSVLGHSYSLVLVATHRLAGRNKVLTLEKNISIVIDSHPTALGLHSFGHFQLYPNPFKERLNIRYPHQGIPTSIDAQLLDSNGTCIQHMRLPDKAHTQSISLGFLPSGLFLLQLKLPNCFVPMNCWRTFAIIKE